MNHGKNWSINYISKNINHEGIMNIKITFTGILLATLLVAPGSAVSQTKNKDTNTSIGSYRKEGIDVVQRRIFRKKGRAEIGFDLGINADNQFLFYEFVQIRPTFHIKEGLAIEASYSRVFNQERAIIKDLQNVPCPPNLIVTDLMMNPVSTCGVDLDPAPDPAKNVYFANLIFSPIYGKFAIFSKKIYHFDWYFVAGAGMFDNERSQRFGINVGTGLKIFLNQSTAFKLDFRNFTVREGAPFNQIANNRVYSIGLSFFLPSTPKD